MELIGLEKQISNIHYGNGHYYLLLLFALQYSSSSMSSSELKMMYLRSFFAVFQEKALHILNSSYFCISFTK